MSKRLACISLTVFAIFIIAIIWSAKYTPLGIGFKLPKVLAQNIQQKCSPGMQPIVGASWQTSGTNGALLQWGCVDQFGDLQIGSDMYVGSGNSLSAALSNLPICNPVPSFNGGNPTNQVSAPCGIVHLLSTAKTTTDGYIVTSPIIINSVMVRITGVDKYATQIQCGSVSPCIKFDGSNLPSFAHNSPNPISGASGGLEKLSLIGSNTASQIGLFNLNAAGIRHTDVRVIGFTGASAIGMEFANDLNGESERVHLDDITFDNNTTSIYFTAPSASNSIAHQYWANVQFTLSNGQTAITVDNFAQVACEFCTGVINTNLPNTNTYTGVKLLSSGQLKGFFRMIVDNGAAGVLTFVTGNTATNFEVIDWSPSNATSYVLSTWDNPLYIITTVANKNNGQCFQQPPGTVQDCIFLDGSNFIGFANTTQENFSISNINGGGIWFNGSASGATNLLPSSAAAGTQTLPTLTGTIPSGIYNSNGTIQTLTPHIVQDTATLAAGTVTVTFTGAAIFTNATSYSCTADDDTAIGATRVLQNSGSSITITGTGTDVIRFICAGN